MVKNSMSRERLEKYRKIRGEIDVLNERIYMAESEGVYTTDIVRGSSSEFPYMEQNISVSGYGSPALPGLLKRRAKCMAEAAAIEEFVDGVEDSVVYQLLSRRYIQGKQLKEVTVLMKMSETHAMRLLRDFFKKNKTAADDTT